MAGPACIPSMTTLAAPPPPSPVVGDNIKPNPASVRLDDVVRDRSNSGVFSSDDKKLLKRAANRRSAQLSRKRKKQYIEELKDENADLRRMELILRSIPDMIVSFDSSGKIGLSLNLFVSSLHSNRKSWRVHRSGNDFVMIVFDY